MENQKNYVASFEYVNIFSAVQVIPFFLYSP